MSEAYAAETQLVGIMLYENSVWPSVSHLPATEFSDPLMRMLWEEIGRIVVAGRMADPVTVWERLKDTDLLLDAGGIRFLAELVDRAEVRGARDYAAVVHDAWMWREMERCAAQASHAVEQGQPISDVIANLKTELDRLESDAAIDEAPTALAAGEDVVAEIEQEIARGDIKGFRCGLKAVDKRLGGLQPESLIVMAARPSMGKTALAGAVLDGAARLHPSRLFAVFSIEMSKRQLIERSLSRLSADDEEPIPYERIGKNDLSIFEMDRLHTLKRSLPANMVIYDTPSLSLADVRRRIWTLKRRGDLAAIVIDYLQIMWRPQGKGRSDTAILGEITSGLKQLAREAKIAIVLLSQLSRAVEQRDDKRPQLSDLRESGSIEQDADSVVFPYREVYYLERSEPKEGTPEHLEWEMRTVDLRRRMDVIVAKHRHGGVGSEPVQYEPAYDHFSNWGDR